MQSEKCAFFGNLRTLIRGMLGEVRFGADLVSGMDVNDMSYSK